MLLPTSRVCGNCHRPLPSLSPLPLDLSMLPSVPPPSPSSHSTCASQSHLFKCHKWNIGDQTRNISNKEHNLYQIKMRPHGFWRWADFLCNSGSLILRPKVSIAALPSESLKKTIVAWTKISSQYSLTWFVIAGATSLFKCHKWKRGEQTTNISNNEHNIDEIKN